jgi:hypothetical protein
VGILIFEVAEMQRIQIPEKKDVHCSVGGRRRTQENVPVQCGVVNSENFISHVVTENTTWNSPAHMHRVLHMFSRRRMDADIPWSVA